MPFMKTKKRDAKRERTSVKTIENLKSEIQSKKIKKFNQFF